ncbi:MAG: carbohydrate kinase [Actinobacteria bacterium]|nr:carbohydrate kinase [Actinomycetota bacterium]
MGRVTCMGLTTLDVVQVVDRLPGPDEKLVASDGWVAFGGPAANAAATSAGLGAATRLVTALGTGPVADLARAGLAAAGVEVVDLAPDVADLLPVSSVLVSGRARAVVSRNAVGAPDLAEAAARVDPGEAGDVLLVDGHHLGAALVVARRARSAGVHVLLDGGSWKPGLERLLAYVDTAVLSGDFVLPGGARPGAVLPGDQRAVTEARPAPAEGVEALLLAVAALGPTVVARSSGPAAVRVLLGPGLVEELSPEQVPAEHVVDTLGAGDVLHGAMAAALAAGAGPLEALASGIRCATESVRHRGALAWLG